MSLATQLTAGPVQRHTPAGQFSRCKILPSPQHRADSGEELPHVEWLYQIIIRSEIQSPDPVVNLGFCSQKQRRRRHTLRPQLLQHGHPVHLRHHDIQNHPVVRTDSGILQGILPIVNRIDGIPGVFQNGAERTGQFLLVVRQQQLHRLALPVLPDLRRPPFFRRCFFRSLTPSAIVLK